MLRQITTKILNLIMNMEYRIVSLTYDKYKSNLLNFMHKGLPTHETTSITCHNQEYINSLLPIRYYRAIKRKQ